MSKDKDELQTIDGVGKDKANVLRKAGKFSIMAVAVSSPKELALCDGISEEAAVKIIASAREMADVGEFITSEELRERRKNLRKLTTSSNNLDSLFDTSDDVIARQANKGATLGGLPTETITEFYGEFSSGKTQICLQLSVNATMPLDKGGLDGHVIWVDTEGTYRPNRIEDMAEAHGLDKTEVLKKIHQAKAYNSSHQILMIETKAQELAEKYPIKLVVVDSLTAHFRSEYIGRGNLGERQQMLNKHMHDLLRFAELNHAVVAVTNQVMANPAQMFGDPTRPVGGHIVGHTSTYRIYLRKGKGGTRVAKMIDSPEHPESESLIRLEKEGIRDG